jgi:hypothetical protein
LIEVIVVLLIFGILIAGIFAIFTYSAASFQHAVKRQGLSGEMEAVQRKLISDFKASHFGTVALVPRMTTLNDGADVPRDAFSFATLSDWQDPTNFHPTGLPRWDRYLVYYPTLEESGRLVRQLVDPGVLYAPVPYAELGTNISEIPNSNELLVQTTVLSNNVLSLTVERNDARQLLEVNLRLRDRGGRVAGSNRQIDETREAVFSMDALNTFPRL